VAARTAAPVGTKIVSRKGLVEPTESSAEPFRTLRVSLELRPESRRGNCVLVTSSEPGEGKSTVAANYAVFSAVNDRRVLLIDADLRNPTQHQIFSVPRMPGLTEVIIGSGDIGSNVTPIESTPGLFVLSAGRSVPRAGDITGSNAVRELLTRASQEFDTVVIDAPPVLAAADAAHLATHPAVDVAFVVTSAQRSRKVSRALAKLSLVNANVLGFVLNREGRVSDYGYG
jgi:capsular exopolysaccharide synthesis family protein